VKADGEVVQDEGLDVDDDGNVVFECDCFREESGISSA